MSKMKDFADIHSDSVVGMSCYWQTILLRLPVCQKQINMSYEI